MSSILHNDSGGESQYHSWNQQLEQRETHACEGRRPSCITVDAFVTAALTCQSNIDIKRLQHPCQIPSVFVVQTWARASFNTASYSLIICSISAFWRPGCPPSLFSRSRAPFLLKKTWTSSAMLLASSPSVQDLEKHRHVQFYTPDSMHSPQFPGSTVTVLQPSTSLGRALLHVSRIQHTPYSLLHTRKLQTRAANHDPTLLCIAPCRFLTLPSCTA